MSDADPGALPGLSAAAVTETLILAALDAVPGLENVRAGRIDDGPVVRFDTGRLQGGVAMFMTGGAVSAARLSGEYRIAVGIRLADDDGTLTRQTMPGGTASCADPDGIAAALTGVLDGIRARWADA